MRTWTVAFVMGTVLGLGCGAVDREADCNRICNKKKDCADANYNVSNCVDYCRSQAKANAEYGQKVNDCSACVETRACNDVVTQCLLKNDCPSLP
jgi:hypothetical protein